MGKKSESQPNRLKWLIAHRRIVATTVFQSVCLLSLTHSHSLLRNKPKKYLCDFDRFRRRSTTTTSFLLLLWVTIIATQSLAIYVRRCVISH